MGGGSCVDELQKAAIDLFNRYEAEIERLQGYNENLMTANTALSNEILDIRAEATKEFAERLKAEIESIKLHEPRQCWNHDTLNAFETKINIILYNLVKEMTEKGDNEK